MPTKTSTLDVSQLIDQQRLGAFALGLAFLSFLIMMTDGYDIVAASYAGPKLVAAWHLDRSALGPIFAASPLGMVVGGPLLGRLGDRLGRRTTILLGVATYAACTLACGFAQSVEQLVVLRFITGAGLGGTLPNVTALNAEYAPVRVRARLIVLMFMGVTAGSTLPGAVIALVPDIDWRTMYIAGGAAPLLLLPALLRWLPESVKFLILSERKDVNAQIVRLMKKVSPGVPVDGDTIFIRTANTGTLKGVSVLDLFKDKLRWITLLLWLVFIINLAASYFLYNWLPILLHAEGLSSSHTALVTMSYYVGGIAGAIIISPLIDKRGFVIIMIYFALAAPAVACIGLASLPVFMKASLVFLAGFFIIGTQLGLNAASGIIYDTPIRATGAGWAFGLGRLGGFVGPMVGAWLMTLHISSLAFFLVPATCLVMGATASFVLTRIVPSRKGSPMPAEIPIDGQKIVTSH